VLFDDGRNTDEVGIPSFVEIFLARVAWALESVRSRCLTFIVHLLSWRWHDLPGYDASQNSQCLLFPFRC